MQLDRLACCASRIATILDHGNIKFVSTELDHHVRMKEFRVVEKKFHGMSTAIKHVNRSTKRPVVLKPTVVGTSLKASQGPAHC